jgi:hypothetical protein
MWGLGSGIPIWRAAECPILDPSKKHFKPGKSMNQSVGDSVSEDQPSNLSETAKSRSQETVHRGMMIVAHRERVAVVVVENGSCEGVRQTEVVDCIVEGMESFNMLPTLVSHPYRSDYLLWFKGYGENECWVPVPAEKAHGMLRIWKESAGHRLG